MSSFFSFSFFSFFFLISINIISSLIINIPAHCVSRIIVGSHHRHRAARHATFSRTAIAVIFGEMAATGAGVVPAMAAAHFPRTVHAFLAAVGQPTVA